jgi:hypothetical protein
MLAAKPPDPTRHHADLSESLNVTRPRLIPIKARVADLGNPRR